jgi:hypothetical protein
MATGFPKRRSLRREARHETLRTRGGGITRYWCSLHDNDINHLEHILYSKMASLLTVQE